MAFELELPAHPDSVARARRAVAGLGDRIPPDRLEDVRLLVSEIVTNAIRHSGIAGGQRISLRIAAERGTVRVEVRDQGRGFAVRRIAPDPTRASGWGLYLVAELADRWGVDDGRETCVWFELE